MLVFRAFFQARVLEGDGGVQVSLMELANTCRTMVSGIFAPPYVIRSIVHNSSHGMPEREHAVSSCAPLPGTAHAPDSSRGTT